jgi:hypothetical protein
MKLQSLAAVAVLGVALSACSTEYSFNPTAEPNQTIRYDRGTPTTLADGTNGSMQVTPLGVNDDKRLVFGVAVLNKSRTAQNFGIEDISVVGADGTTTKVYSRDELVHEAKVRAEWHEAAAILVGAAAAYAATQNAYSTTNGYVASNAFVMGSNGYSASVNGISTFSSRTYDPTAAVLGAAAATAATGYTLNSIKSSLDQALDHYNGQVLQTTTVDPGSNFGGEVIADMPSGSLPEEMLLHANWNGEQYEFRYTLGKK